MITYDNFPEIKAVLNTHKARAGTILNNAQSQLLYDTFSGKLSSLFEVSESVDGDILNLDIDNVKEVINGWKSDMDNCYMEFALKLERQNEITDEDHFKKMSMKLLIDEIKKTYDDLNKELDEVELNFKNAVRLYRSPMRAALTDISMLYNSENNVKGDFSGFKNVSVYVHGIEDTGEDFRNSVEKVASKGDIIVHIKEDGTEEYLYVDVKTKEIKTYSTLKELQQSNPLANTKGRLHIIYDTENRNEHRQETSDDLARKLDEMGVINNKTKIDMFAHSYGGRRSFQFAIDYPDNVRSITTIGTPYDTNSLAKGANDVRWAAKVFANRNPRDDSGYLDFNEKSRNETKGVKYSNAYTDMSTEPLLEDIHKLKAANPEVYDKLQKMDITAAGGYRKVWGVKFAGDDIVSLKSQNAEILEDLIDDRPQYQVKGIPGHTNEVTDDDFINLIEEVNKNQMSRSN
ncbi:alpha/beta fold hydrolase [Metabacillus fastidiosus]|uniref:alpha/beta fold hydrolase n=1 Tax=Metabacillus fastidiosus TaxID=1458 RepID=UPI003D2E117D